MKIKTLVVGQLSTNCYLVYDEKDGEAIIIDPGDAGDYLAQQVLELKLLPQAIVATHGHFDHLLAAEELKLIFDVPFLIHRADLFLVKRVGDSAKYFLGVRPELVVKPERFIKEDDEIIFGKERLKVLETPGHTPGGICLYGKGVLFSGDTLFSGGVGRTDFAYSSNSDLQKSLEKLRKLPPDTVVYPGHGPSTRLDLVGGWTSKS